VFLHHAQISHRGSSGLPEATFDHAWARFVLEYQPDPVEFVREMARLVRPGGKVTLIDLEGNGTRHFGMSPGLRRELDAILRDLATTGFDPDAGSRLAGYALAAGLVGVRHEIEPYHRIVGRPDAHTLDLWRRKLEILASSYERRFPERSPKRDVFAALLEFLASPHTMTWSLLHLVQATRPPLNRVKRRSI
jgi:SAM-dependent methyltransferase